MTTEESDVFVAHMTGLFRCAAEGCQAPVLLSASGNADAVGRNAAEIGLALDKQYVYWGSRDGTIYHGDKSANPGSPKRLIAGVNA